MTIQCSLRAADGAGIVRIDNRYDTNIDDLWSAITDPRRLARWHAEVEGDLRAGGELRIHMESEGWDGTGRIEVCEPPRHLRLTTKESEESWRKGVGAPPFEEVIEATLTADGDKTILLVEVRGLPLDKIAFYGAGWHIHAENLAAYVDGRGPIDVEARFEELVPPYQELAAKIR